MSIDSRTKRRKPDTYGIVPNLAVVVVVLSIAYPTAYLGGAVRPFVHSGFLVAVFFISVYLTSETSAPERRRRWLVLAMGILAVGAIIVG